MSSGNPAKRSWEPMRLADSTTDLVRNVYLGTYRTPMRIVRTEVWENRLYNGWLYWFEDGSGHFTFKRQDRTPIRDWRHMQSIKNEVAGAEREAIEIFPPESQLVDGANEFHLFILPEGQQSPLGFTRRAVGDLVDTYDRQAQLQGNPRPGARQRSWQPGLSTGPFTDEAP